MAGAAACGLLVLSALGALGQTGRVRSVFHIDKSENRNQVHYDVLVDGSCRPLNDGADPIVAYWRMRERGPGAVEPLTFFERRAYGVSARNLTVQPTPEGGLVRFALRPLPRRRIAVQTFARHGRCAARGWTEIEGEQAILDSVYVKVGFLGADYVILHGRRPSGETVRETLR